MTELTHVSLFSGIGGLDRGAGSRGRPFDNVLGVGRHLSRVKPPEPDSEAQPDDTLLSMPTRKRSCRRGSEAAAERRT